MKTKTPTVTSLKFANDAIVQDAVRHGEKGYEGPRLDEFFESSLREAFSKGVEFAADKVIPATWDTPDKKGNDDYLERKGFNQCRHIVFENFGEILRKLSPEHPSGSNLE